jgi:hypothetical protein
MDERTGSVRLVDSHPASDGRTFAATLPRDEVEKALQSDEPVDLLLEVERVAADGSGRETERIALGWEPEELERLLAEASGGDVTLTFDEGELRQLLDADVDAHGMRERIAVLSVVAGLAAAGAGGAAAMVTGAAQDGSAGTQAAVTHVTPSEVSTGLTTPAAAPASEVSAGVGVGAPSAAQAARVATPSEISTGITGTEPAPPSEISTGIVQQPAPSAPEVTTGVSSEPTATPAASSPSWSSPSPETLAIAAGAILAITALGFAARSQRVRPRPI